jgi:hypothetical protein
VILRLRDGAGSIMPETGLLLLSYPEQEFPDHLNTAGGCVMTVKNHLALCLSS